MKFNKIAIFFSFFGLISCAEDYKDAPIPKADDFEVKAPQSTDREGKVWTWSQLEEEKKSFLSSDAFDFDFEKVKQYKIETRCHRDDKVFERSRTFKRHKEIKVIDLINGNTFLHYQSDSVTCDFIFLATNTIGSSHKHVITGREVVLSKIEPITLMAANHKTNPKRLSFENFKDSIIQSDISFDQLHLQCEQVEKSIKYDRWPTLLKVFSFTMDELKKAPLQSCRIFSLLKNQLQAKSQAFKIVFPQESPSHSYVPRKNTINFLSKNSYLLEVKLKNETPWIQTYNYKTPSHLKVFASRFPQSTKRKIEWRKAVRIEKDGTLYSSETSKKQFQLGPNESTTFRVYIDSYLPCILSLGGKIKLPIAEDVYVDLKGLGIFEMLYGNERMWKHPFANNGFQHIWGGKRTKPQDIIKLPSNNRSSCPN